MPQVTRAKPVLLRRISVITLIVSLMAVSAVVLTSLILLSPKKALAATSELPIPADDSSGMSLAVSQSSTGAIINAQDDWIKLYFKASDVGVGKIDIYNAPFDCNSQADFVRPFGACSGGLSDAPSQRVLYDFYSTNANESIGPLLFTMDGQTGKNLGNGTQLATVQTDGWSTGIPVPVGGTISTLTGYKVVLMRAYYAQPLPGGLTSRLHAYLVRTESNQDLLGYWAQASPPGTACRPQRASTRFMISEPIALTLTYNQPATSLRRLVP